MKEKLAGNFLAVDKNYFTLGLKGNQILILAQIAEFNRTTGDCFMSDQAFAKMLGCSESTISRDLKELENRKLITRETKNVRGGKERHLRLTSINLTVVNEDESSTSVNLQVDKKQNIMLTSVNLQVDNLQNDSIKENIKRKDLKENDKRESAPLEMSKVLLDHSQIEEWIDRPNGIFRNKTGKTIKLID